MNYWKELDQTLEHGIFSLKGMKTIAGDLFNVELVSYIKKDVGQVC